MIPMWFARLTEERDQLKDRLDKLSDYLRKGAPGVDPRHHGPLAEQERHMAAYLDVLNRRVDIGF